MTQVVSGTFEGTILTVYYDSNPDACVAMLTSTC
jgi:hypothetical protein